MKPTCALERLESRRLLAAVIPFEPDPIPFVTAIATVTLLSFLFCETGTTL